MPWAITLSRMVQVAVTASIWRPGNPASNKMTAKTMLARPRGPNQPMKSFPDDISYVTKDQAETSVLFELISRRYEHRSILITANQTFGEWNKIFPDQAMTLAAVDRLVHHATIIEMNVESYRRRAAIEQKQAPVRPEARQTPKASS